MVDVRLHKFPTAEAAPDVIEKAYCELLSRERDGETFDVETRDWMDSANTWLIESK